MTRDRVVVVGGGLAGITAAIGLAEGGLPVTLLESRPWLGGAAWSFGRRGLTIDNGQHAFLRCFTAYRDLLARLGVGSAVHIQDRLDLTLLTADGPRRIRRNAWPAPLHLARMLAGYRSLSRAERLAVVPAVMTMWLSDLSGSGQGNASVADWLGRRGQGERARSQFWDAFLVPFLNAPSDQADLGIAAGVINAALLSSRDQADLGITSVPLRDLHAGPAARLLGQLGAEVRTGAEVTAIRREPGAGYTVKVGPDAAEGQPRQLAFGQCDPDVINAAGVVLAVPAWSAAALVPPELSSAAAAWSCLRPSPVVSIHVIYDSRVTRLPFAISTDSPLRWITDKTSSAGLHTGQYLAASIPAADEYVDAPAAGIREQFLPVLEQLFPAAASARVEDFFVTRERSATFRPAPGSGAFRPGQVTELPGFTLAGAWTRTGWPDTMEGAVRSGRLAAECVLSVLAADADPAGVESARPRLRDAAEALRMTGGKLLRAPASPSAGAEAGKPKVAGGGSAGRKSGAATSADRKSGAATSADRRSGGATSAGKGQTPARSAAASAGRTGARQDGDPAMVSAGSKSDATTESTKHSAESAPVAGRKTGASGEPPAAGGGGAAADAGGCETTVGQEAGAGVGTGANAELVADAAPADAAPAEAELVAEAAPADAAPADAELVADAAPADAEPAAGARPVAGSGPLAEAGARTNEPVAAPLAGGPDTPANGEAAARPLSSSPGVRDASTPKRRQVPKAAPGPDDGVALTGPETTSEHAKAVRQ